MRSRLARKVGWSLNAPSRKRQIVKPGMIVSAEASPRHASAQDLGPTEFSQSQACVPNFGHVANLLAFELHHINIVGPCRLPSWSGWSTLPRVGGRKDCIRRDVIALMVNRKRLNIVASVRLRRVK